MKCWKCGGGNIQGITKRAHCSSHQEFRAKIRAGLEDDAELLGAVADKIILGMDGVIGWKTTETELSSKASNAPVTEKNRWIKKIAEKWNHLGEIQLPKPVWPFILALLLTLAIGFLIGKQNGGQAPASIVTELPVSNPSPTTESLPKLLSVYWDETEKTVAVQWDSNGTTGPWDIYYECNDFHNSSDHVLVDYGVNTTYLDNKWLAPGMTVRVWVRKLEPIDDRSWGVLFNSEEYADLKIPISPGSSELEIVNYNINMISKAAIGEMNQRISKHNYENWDEFVALSTENISANIIFSEVREKTNLRFAVFAPSGKIKIIRYDWIDKGNSGIDFSINLSYVFQSHDEDYAPETGEYTIIWYNWDSMTVIGQCKFLVY